MINTHFIKPEKTQISRNYLDGWNQALQAFHQMEREIKQDQKKALRKKQA